MTFPKYLNLRSFISEENEEVWNHLFFIPALKILWSNARASMMLLATVEMRGNLGQVKFAKTSGTVTGAGADLEGGCRGCAPLPPTP